MEGSEAIERLAAARRAHLATVGEDGSPHLVPIVFALVDDHVVTAVDHKPKRSTALKRLANIETNRRVAVLVDHYSEQWDELWWVRVDGNATVLTPDQGTPWLPRLVAKYHQYRVRPPTGPVVIVEIHRVTGWQAS